MKTLVIGLGNPILSDDGVGIYAARRVRAALPPDAEVEVRELAVGGLTLMEAMIGYDRVILIDALLTANGQVGQVVQLDMSELPDTLNTASAHDVTLTAALRLGRHLGAALPADEHIHIVGVHVQDVWAFSDSPTAAVVRSLPQVEDLVLYLIGYARMAVVSPDYLINGGYDDFS